MNSPIIVENKNLNKSEKKGLLDTLDEISETQRNNELFNKFAVKSSNTFKKKISINSMFEEEDKQDETQKPELKLQVIEEKENKTNSVINNSDNKKIGSTHFVNKSNKNTTTTRKTNENKAALVKDNVKITDYLSKFRYTNSNKLSK
jgi:hypothetical protein